MPGAPPALRYSLRRLYASPTLELAGQKVGVLLPFSDGAYYEEALVNKRAVVAALRSQDFALTVDASLADSIPDFAARNHAVASQLSAGDRAWLALYRELVFQRAGRPAEPKKVG